MANGHLAGGLNKGDVVLLTCYPDHMNQAKVLTKLSSQFTCEDSTGRTLFFFYGDEGVTWTRLKQGS